MGKHKVTAFFEHKGCGGIVKPFKPEKVYAIADDFTVVYKERSKNDNRAFFKCDRCGRRGEVMQKGDLIPLSRTGEHYMTGRE